MPDDAAQFFKNYSLADIGKVLGPRLTPDVTYSKEAPCKLTGLLLARGATTVAFSMGNDVLLEIPIDAILTITDDPSPPAVLPSDAMAVQIEILATAPLTRHLKITAHDLGDDAGLKPFALATPSASKIYAVPAEKVDDRDRARNKSLGFEAQVETEQGEDGETPASIPQAPGPQALVAPASKLAYTKDTAQERHDTLTYQSPQDTAHIIHGKVLYRTDMEQDEFLAVTTEISADTAYVEEPATTHNSYYDTKSTQPKQSPFETKSIVLEQQVSSPDHSGDFYIDVASDNTADMEHIDV